MGVVHWEQQINFVSLISRTCCKPNPSRAAAARILLPSMPQKGARLASGSDCTLTTVGIKWEIASEGKNRPNASEWRHWWHAACWMNGEFCLGLSRVLLFTLQTQLRWTNKPQSPTSSLLLSKSEETGSKKAENLGMYMVRHRGGLPGTPASRFQTFWEVQQCCTAAELKRIESSLLWLLVLQQFFQYKRLALLLEWQDEKYYLQLTHWWGAQWVA